MTTLIKVIEYKDEHKSIFRELNLEWLNHYNLAESHDLKILDDPKGTILDGGGFIYLASVNDYIVGSAALMKEHDGIYELVKMGVKKEYRGNGISRLLIDQILAKARELNAKIILFSNHKLQTAIGIYEKYGFRHVEIKDSPFDTADIKMELDLEPVSQ